MMTQKKYRQSARKDVKPLTLESINSLENLEKLASYGEIIQASANGLLIQLDRTHILSKNLKSNINIDQLVGHKIYFNIHEMDLEISGTVARTKYCGKDKGYQIAVDYSEDAPEYWRECLMDLLPHG